MESKELLLQLEKHEELQSILKFSGIDAKLYNPTHHSLQTGDEVDLIVIQLEPDKIHQLYIELLDELFRRNHTNIEVYSFAMQQQRMNSTYTITFKYKEAKHEVE